jgi:hypothetical protein
MFWRRRRSGRRANHDAESRTRALETVERLAQESEHAPREIERHRLSRAAMDRQRISRGDGSVRGRDADRTRR